jgi:hypothetical protein
MLKKKCSHAVEVLLAAALAFAPILRAQSKQGPTDGLLLGAHKSGEHREIETEGGSLRTLERYAFESHDDYDFVVQVGKTIFVGRIRIPHAARSAGPRLLRAWPGGTCVQVRLMKKGVFKKRMEMKLVSPSGKKIPLLLVSVKDPTGRELCEKSADPPDCTRVNPHP